MPRDSLGDKKTAAQISVENEIPVVPGNLERRFADVTSGIVYEDVDPSECIVSVGAHSLDALLVADIEFE